MATMQNPAGELVAIAPSDTTDFTDQNGNEITARGLLIGTDGTIKIKYATGKTATIPAGILATNIVHPIQYVRIYLTGTGASNIYGGFDTRSQF